MLKREIVRRLLPAFLYFLFVAILNWPVQISWLLFLVGLFLGSFILELDQIIYCYFQAPHELASQRLRRLISLNQYSDGLNYLFYTGRERTKTVFHSAFFQIILLIAVFFVLTSTSSLLGKGLVLGLFLHMLVVQVRELRVEGNMDRWFWNFKSVPTPQIQLFYFFVMCLLFFGISFFI